MEKIRELFPICKSFQAWSTDNSTAYEACNFEISTSNSNMHDNIEDVQTFSLHHDASLSIQIQLEQVTEDVDIRLNISRGLEKALEYIKNVSSASQQHLPSCSGMAKK